MYWQGELQHAESPCIAFVGSTRRLVKEISQYVPDMIIVRGLGKGIYTGVHETELEFGLKTISILAGVLQHIYPPDNKNPAEEILKNGALVS